MNQVDAKKIELFPEGFQRSEFLLAHGLIDMIVKRKDSRDVVGQIIEYTAAGGGKEFVAFQGVFL